VQMTVMLVSSSQFERVRARVFVFWCVCVCVCFSLFWCECVCFSLFWFRDFINVNSYVWQGMHVSALELSESCCSAVRAINPATDMNSFLQRSGATSNPLSPMLRPFIATEHADERDSGDLPADATVLTFSQFAGPSGTRSTTHMSMDAFQSASGVAVAAAPAEATEFAGGTDAPSSLASTDIELVNVSLLPAAVPVVPAPPVVSDRRQSTESVGSTLSQHTEVQDSSIVFQIPSNIQVCSGCGVDGDVL
jgi:hypothetical protein